MASYINHIHFLAPWLLKIAASFRLAIVIIHNICLIKNEKINLDLLAHIRRPELNSDKCLNDAKSIVI